MSGLSTFFCRRSYFPPKNCRPSSFAQKLFRHKIIAYLSILRIKYNYSLSPLLLCGGGCICIKRTVGSFGSRRLRAPIKNFGAHISSPRNLRDPKEPTVRFIHILKGWLTIRTFLKNVLKISKNVQGVLTKRNTQKSAVCSFLAQNLLCVPLKYRKARFLFLCVPLGKCFRHF